LRVKRYLLEKLKSDKALHITLIDPAKISHEEVSKISEEAVRAGSSAIMIGGSVGVSESMVDKVIVAIKKTVDVPVILFPGTPCGISKYADAVWFLSVLNSRNSYFITGGQAQAAPIIKKYEIEPLSLAYLILGEGGTVSYVSHTEPIPLDKPEIVVAYSLVAEFFGFSFLYLEGGSGSSPVSSEIVKVVRRNVNIPIIVGGGIRDYETAKNIVKAGADIIVTGNLIETTNDVYMSVKEIVEGAKRGIIERSTK